MKEKKEISVCCFMDTSLNEHTYKARNGETTNEMPTRYGPKKTCSLLLRSLTGRLSSCIYLSSMMPVLAELVQSKALQFTYVRAKSMARFNLSRCAQSHSFCIFCIGRKGFSDFRSRKRNPWRLLRVSGETASLSSNPMSVWHMFSRENIYQYPRRTF